ACFISVVESLVECHGDFPAQFFDIAKSSLPVRIVESADSRHSHSELLPGNAASKDQLEGDNAPGACDLFFGRLCFGRGFCTFLFDLCGCSQRNSCWGAAGPANCDDLVDLRGAVAPVESHFMLVLPFLVTGKSLRSRLLAEPHSRQDLRKSRVRSQLLECRIHLYDDELAVPLLVRSFDSLKGRISLAESGVYPC